ncbi:MAG: ACP S-malonyltransferase [Proteobacteria bacterium]|nr:ACP S-malonyltransferase [Pseudomonadota bacterium]MBU4297407.1 ACP S-malonyltransferase [Pseudomonadota bacterium]MCG2748751.1 ACP S-malonyltransferase [Desulfobulbaceae bacterium]
MTDTINNAAKTAFLFPGQGSQFVGMGRDFLAEYDDARRLMSMAEQVSGFPLEQFCLEGPLAELTRTLHLQPGMTVLDLICLQALRQAGINAEFFAGHSLGEYSALAAAGVLSAEDTLRLVTERGRLMERESAVHPGAMSAILKLGLAAVQEVVQAAAAKGVVVAANHNSEMQIVISGDAAGVEAASALAAQKGGKAVALPVSGAWHSPLVADAVPDFEKAMEQITFHAPVGKIFFNVTASPENDPAAIRSIMSRQIASMVRWYDTILAMRQQGVTTFIEVGPKNVLTGLLKKILPKGHDCTCLQVEDPASLKFCLQTLQP